MEDRSSPHRSSRSEVDTSRPSRSVKEAVAVSGERILAGDFHAQKQNNVVILERRAWKSASSASSFASLPQIKEEEDESAMMDSIKKLEAELEETRRELKQLKERESEIAVASLNSDLHMSMCKLAKAEAAKAVLGGKQEIVEEDKKGNSGLNLKQSQCLAEILSPGEEGFFGTPLNNFTT